MTNSEIRNSKFDWRIFADATCAGLTVRIPVPFVDMVFEAIFRRRIPGTIASARRRPVAPAVRRRLGRAAEGAGLVQGCLATPVVVVTYVLRRLWRKIVYILAVKDAAVALSRYWHRAYLIDHMVTAGHLDHGVDTGLAVRVFTRTLRDIDPSPLMGLARQTVANTHHVLRLLVEARRLGAAEVTRSFGRILTSHWQQAEASLAATTALYDQSYRAALGLDAVGHEESGA